jgi:hypothetical protein
MPEDAATHEVTIWTDARRAPLIGQVLDRLGKAVRPIGLGGPRGARLSSLHGHVEGQPYDDLRKMAIDRPAAFVLLGTLDGVSTEELVTAMEQGSTLLTLEPIAADLRDLAALRPKVGAAAGRDPAARRVELLPSFRQSPGLIQAADPHDVIGDARLIAYAHLGPADEGGLFTRLYDSWSAVLRFAPLPESIDAALTSITPQVAENPRELAGYLSAHGRLGGECSVTLAASDQAATSRRAMTVLGVGGELSVDDHGYVLLQADGTEVDASQRKGPAPGYVDLVVAQWQRILARGETARPEGGLDGAAETLACCLASLLSARTGQPESPGRILEIQG